MKTVRVYMDDEQARKLKALCAMEDRHMSPVGEVLFDLYLTHGGVKKLVDERLDKEGK